MEEVKDKVSYGSLVLCGVVVLLGGVVTVEEISLSLIPPSLLLHFDITVDFLRDIARAETNEFLSQCNNAAIVLGGFGGSLIQFLAFIFPEARWLLLAAAILFLVGGITGLAGAPTTVKKIAMSFGGFGGVLFVLVFGIPILLLALLNPSSRKVVSLAWDLLW